MSGVLIIDKPGGMTSHDVVQRIRRLLNTSKVGHLGTLDPMATGVLPVCIGKATRIGQFLTTSPKEYTGEIRFGFSTDTYDREGAPTSEEKPFVTSEADLDRAMQQMTGMIDQTPPAFSAKKIGGVPSYKMARRGHAVENAAVRVEVMGFELLLFRPPLVQFRVTCSAGTYIRSLAHDLGQHWGCGAHLESLRRVRSGDFRIEQAVPLDKAGATDVIPVEKLLLEWPCIMVSDENERRVRQGNPICTESTSDFLRIFNKRGEFLAVANIESGWARPKVVLTSKASVELGTAHRVGPNGLESQED